MHGFVGSSQGYGGKFWFWLRRRQSVLSRQINQEIECLSLMCLWAADKFGSFDLRFVGEHPSRSSLQLFHSWVRKYSEGHVWNQTRFMILEDKPSETQVTIPVGSMYGIYANIWGILMENVIIYRIHGSHGICHNIFITTVLIPFSGSDPWVWWCETTGFHPGFFAKPVGHPTTWRLTWLLLVGKSKYKLVYARI